MDLRAGILIWRRERLWVHGYVGGHLVLLQSLRRMRVRVWTEMKDSYRKKEKKGRVRLLF